MTVNRPLQVLYEDNHMLIVLKEPNIPVQADASGDMDLLSMVKEYIREKYNKPGDAYAGLVHRMDRPVGGLLVFARTSKAAARLSAQVQSHTMSREYVCVCEGELPDRFTLHDWLQKDEKTNMVKVIPPYLKLQGKEAILHGFCVARQQKHSLACIRLETGRAHQIRVQMQYAGHPLWGDQRYGSGRPGQQIALWGMRLTLHHPITNENMVFVAPPPADNLPWSVFQNIIDALTTNWPKVQGTEQHPL